MKVVTCPAYGPPDVLRLEEVPQPSPAEGEVVVQVVAASVNAADWHLMRGDPFPLRLAMGLRRPNIKGLGADVAGRVVAVGAGVTSLAPGDEVFGDLSGSGFGAFAEYACAPAGVWARKPSAASFVEAAALPMASVTALRGVRDTGGLQPGWKVLVVGASGGVGSFAVQIARVLGGSVTALCSPAKADAVATLKPDAVIDFSTLDAGDQEYDLIVDAAAFRPVFGYRRFLRPGGTYVLAGGTFGAILRVILLGPIVSLATGKRFKNYLSTPDARELGIVGEWVDGGKVRPLIDRTFPLEQAPDALRHIEARHTRGKVVITVEPI